MRRLTVNAITDLTPHMRRITFSGETLVDMQSDGFDDHVKLLLPPPGHTELVLPPPGPDGLPDWGASEAVRPVARDYTPRYLDRDACLLDIDFALHGEGPASTWAARVKIGDTVVVGGPRGSMVVPVMLHWQWLIGDESALPAIARRLEQLGDSVKVTVVIETSTIDESLPPLMLGENARLIRVGRPESANEGEVSAPLLTALRDLRAPTGLGHTFVAAEHATVRQVRQLLLEHHGLSKGQIRASAYWRRGASGHHENLDA